MQLVMIGGAQRSGTTLLQTMLVNGLRNAPLLPEAHIMCDLMRIYQRANNEFRKTSMYYEDKTQLLAFFRMAADAHIHDIGNRYPGLDHLVLKDPNFGHVVQEAVELFARVQLIICVRDPRDIAASFIKIGERQLQIGVETPYTRRAIGYICKKIKASYDALMAPSLPNHVLLVKYESLVDAPKETLKTISAQSGLNVDIERSCNPQWLQDNYRHQATWITDLEGGPPNSLSVGSFVGFLTKKEIGKVEQTCRDMMEFFGYEPVYRPEPTRGPLLRALRRVIGGQ